MASGGKDTDVSDDDIRRPVVKHKRKKCKKIISSESEDSDVEISCRRRVRPLQSESEESQNLDSDKIICAEFSTDPSDNEQAEKCAICLSKFSGQDIATPEACDHVFCLECLQEWAKNVNTCPIDRLKFNLILIRHHKEEKIIKTIFVDNSEINYNSESESNTESQVNYCELCGEDENEGSLLLCRECHKFYHYGCIIPNLHTSRWGHWQCPNCDCYVLIRDKFLLEAALIVTGRKLQDVHSMPGETRRSNFSTISHPFQGRTFINREYARRRQRYQRKQFLRNILSTSESSDEELERRTIASRFYQNHVTSRSNNRSPLMTTKRRNELYRARNQRLVSSAAAASTNTQSFFAADSDEGYSDFRISSPPASENFDVVGSILQSQTLLHGSDVLTLSRAGTIFQNSKAAKNQSIINLDSASPIHNNEDNNSNDVSVQNLPVFSGNTSPYINNAVGRQIPLHSTQNNTSKYGETPRQNYTCGSSSAPRERSLSYDECILSRSAIGSGDNERYNEPNSPISQKSFCSTSASDDMKKALSGNKDANKSHHSEEEVDIYSDIESVGEEDNSMSDKIEPIKMSYKCEESQLSDTNDVSDSDNELVIDEDVPIEEENEKLKEVQGFKYSKNDCPNPKSDRHGTDQEMEDCCPADTENDYPASPFPIKKYDNYNSGSISSKQISCEEKITDSLLESTHKNESSSDVEPQESDMEDDENSLDSTRKSFQGCGSTSCSVKSSPKSLTHCENSISNENEFCENSCLGNEIMKPTSDDHSNHENNNTNDSESQMEVEEFNENNSYKSDSFSQVGEPYKHKKYNFCVTSEQIDEQSRVGDLDSNENSRNDGNSNSSFTQFPLNNERIGLECVALSPSKNNSHFSFASSREKANICGAENCADSYDSNCAYSQAGNSTAFDFKCTQKDSKQNETEGCLDSNENSQNEPHSNLSSSKYEQNADISEAEELADSNENTRTENNSHFGFINDQQNADGSDIEDLADSNPVSSKAPVTSSVTTETINISNDETMKSENDEDDCDSFEDASTPCLDENLDGEIENSPIRNVHFESANQEFSRTPDYEYENETFSMKQNHNIDSKHKQLIEVEANKDEVDLGIEDISEAGSEDLDEFPEDTSADTKEIHATSIDDGCAQHALEASHKFFSPSHLNQAFEDQEEGEIIEEKPARVSDRKCSKHDRYYDDSTEYGELTPRMSISDLPRIPKIKRNREKDTVPEALSFETKRSSVLSRVDLDAVDVSWKRLSKHTRERSYRDGRPKDERLLYRERESRNKERKNVDSGRRTESKNSERRHEEKKNSDKSKSESRSRKSDKTKEVEYDYSERDKRKSHKDHKEKHSKEKHSKDKKHDKIRYSKDETKYEREKTKEEVRYEREARYDKEERFERVVYEKNKTKEKEHKNKRKDRKNEGNKSSKDHSREKHKHSHNSESFSDKQREREVRKIDDKLKIVVEQKEKEKSKNKDRKETKYEKDLHQRKRETGSNLYSEMTSIESKEIFAKGDSIIINVSFNRASSPKDASSTDGIDIKTTEQKLPLDEFDQNGNLSEDAKGKSKNVSDKAKSALDCMPTKRPATPPERPIQVLSVSESYWQGGDDPDGNNSVTSEKSEEGTHVEDENDLMESADETGNFSSASNSTDAPATTTTLKEDEQEVDVKSNAPEENADNFSEKEKFTPKRRSPRSPSPPSPADNDSYDPCEPTRSPSPPPPIPPPLPSSNPKPPPSPELPPLPPEPEPIDAVPEDTLQTQPEFNIPNAAVSSAPQPVTVETQTPSSLAFTGMLLPPPSFFTSTSNSLPNISSLLPPRTMSFQAGNSNVIPPSHMSQVMGGNFLPSQMHGGSTLPPPPNPPNIPHMTSVPPPPPPPSAMALISQVRHPQLNVQPPIPPTSLLQNLSMAHGINIPQLQLPPLPHLPPNLCAALANHQSPLTYTSQNQPTSLPININQQGSRIMLAPNQISLMPNQNMSNTNKPHVMSITQMLSHCQTIPVTSTQKPEEPNKPSTPTEKNEVVDMDVDSPYSPGDCSVDSVNDYSPTGSPLPCTPKTGDIFDTLFTAADVRTSDKRTHDSAAKSERSKSRSGSKSTNETPSKKLKHDHRGDSKVRHSVRMQLEKNKKTRKEQKIAEKISKLDDSQLKILDDLPSSAVEMQVKEKFLKKLNRQERVIEEVKLALKPYYKSRDVNKEEYKDILRRAVPKICHNKSGEINPVKVKSLVESYVKKVKHSRKRGDKRKSKFS